MMNPMETEDWPVLIQKRPKLFLLGYFPPFWLIGWLWVCAYSVHTLFDRKNVGFMDLRILALGLPIIGLMWPSCAYNGAREPRNEE